MCVVECVAAFTAIRFLTVIDWPFCKFALSALSVG